MIIKYTKEDITISSYIHAGKKHPNIVYILLHGIFSDHNHAFAPQIKHLKQMGVTIIAPDLPGHGNSTRKAGLRIDELIDTVLSYFNHEKLVNRKSKIVIIGHSLGTIVAQQLAYTLSQNNYNISHVILLCPFLYPLNFIYHLQYLVAMNLGGSLPQTILHSFFHSTAFRILIKKKNGLTLDDLTILRYKREFTKRNFNNLRELFGVKQLHKIDLHKINYKIINVRAEHDVVSRKKDFLVIAKFYKEHCYSMIVKDADHLIQIYQKEKVNALISQWHKFLITS